MDTHAFVDDLTDDVCQTLLASHDVGRLAFLGDDGYPIVFPVDYAIDGEDIIEKTDHGEMYEHVPPRHHWLAIRIERISGRQIVRPVSQDSDPHEPNGATDG